MNASSNPPDKVQSVTFYLDNTTVYVDNEPPYIWKWIDGSRGLHNIKIVATAPYGYNTSKEITVYKLL